MSVIAKLRRSCRAVSVEGLEERKLFAGYRVVDLSLVTDPSGTGSGVALDVSQNGVVVGANGDQAGYWTPKADGSYRYTALGQTGVVVDVDSGGRYMVTGSGGAGDSRFYVDGKRVAIKDPAATSGEDDLVLELTAVNASGTAIGWVTDIGDADAPTRFVVVDPSGIVSPLPVEEGTELYSVTAINDKGVIFGTAITGDSYRPVLIRGRNAEFLRPFDGFDQSNVFSTAGLNKFNAAVVGTYEPSGLFAFYYVNDTRASDGPPAQLPFAKRTEARSINDEGDVVGEDKVQFAGAAPADVGGLVEPSATIDTASLDLYAINNRRFMVGVGLNVDDGSAAMPKPVVLVREIAPPTFAIFGQLFNDDNGNGVEDATDQGTGVRTVFLDADGDGKLDAGETSVQSDAAGNYVFEGLVAGTYKVSRVFPAGYQLSNGGGKAYVTATVSGKDVGGVDLGTRRIPATGRIRGTVFADANRNGKLDSGERPFGVVTLFLDANNNGKLDAGETRTTSDRNGGYAFADLAPRTYRVRAVAPAGQVVTTVPSTINVTAGSVFGSANIGLRKA